jgi:hypothetical protein
LTDFFCEVYSRWWHEMVFGVCGKADVGRVFGIYNKTGEAETLLAPL